MSKTERLAKTHIKEFFDRIVHEHRRFMELYTEYLAEKRGPILEAPKTPKRARKLRRRKNKTAKQ